MNISDVVKNQIDFFAQGKTFDVSYRIATLKKLKQAIIKHQREIYDALKADLGKSETESYMCEVGLVLSELSYQIKHIKKWSKPKRKKMSLPNFHSKSFIVQEPMGVTLVMSPWNYPILLTLDPVIGAVGAGNCCVVKPSAYSPKTSSVIKKIISDVFEPGHVTVIEGGREQNTQLLNQRFDYIFFTGSVNVGKLVMEKASSNLTPVTLELGGKSPCIIDRDTNLKLAAKRIVFGKYLNCGQTCVAPDYIFVPRDKKSEFIKYVKEEIISQFGEKPLDNENYGKIINAKHYERLMGLIDNSKVVIGGKGDKDSCRIEPTVLDNVTAKDAVMQEEIFGPIMPILEYEKIDQVENFIKEREKPLALYLFTDNKQTEDRLLKYVSFGGGCINDVVVHLSTEQLAFGGVGYSGMGSYHGRKSFDTFSHEKSIMKKYNWIDLPMRYQPYTKDKLNLIKKFLK